MNRKIGAFVEACTLVERANFISLFELAVDKVTPNKPASACYQYSHFSGFIAVTTTALSILAGSKLSNILTPHKMGKINE